MIAEQSGIGGNISCTETKKLAHKDVQVTARLAYPCCLGDDTVAARQGQANSELVLLEEQEELLHHLVG